MTIKSAGDLLASKCIPCEGGVPPLGPERIVDLRRHLSGGWSVVGNHHLEKEYPFPEFKTALAFTNRVGALAEEEGHHPDVLLKYGSVHLTLWTHAVDGLTENDFILAAKIDRL
jgi:4a-hydroxytetrahydrobiopterin dehydratase